MRKRTPKPERAPAVTVQRLVSRWRRQAKKMHHNATLWQTKQDGKDKLLATAAVEWSIGLAAAYTICAQELEEANAQGEL